MNKQQFIEALNEKLCGLPKNDVDERIAFYIEMIDDRIEEGLRESEAVADVGSVETIAEQIRSDLCAVETLPKKDKQKNSEKRKMKAWEIVLLVLGFPLWFPLLISAVAVVFSLYVVVWSLVVLLWAIGAALAASGIGVIVLGVSIIVKGNAISGLALIGLAIAAVGLSIFMFFGCRETTKGMVWLTKLPFAVIKSKGAKGEKKV